MTFRWDFLLFSGWSGCPYDCHTAIKVHICPTPLHSLTWQATQSHIAASSDDWQVHGHGQVSGQATQSHWPVTTSDAQAVSQPPQLLSELLGCLADNKAREMVKNTYAKNIYIIATHTYVQLNTQHSVIVCCTWPRKLDTIWTPMYTIYQMWLGKLSLAMIADICEHYMRWLWLITMHSCSLVCEKQLAIDNCITSCQVYQ